MVKEDRCEACGLSEQAHIDNYHPAHHKFTTMPLTQEEKDNQVRPCSPWFALGYLEDVLEEFINDDLSKEELKRKVNYIYARAEVGYVRGKW
jgi:hypothetical protein